MMMSRRQLQIKSTQVRCGAIFFFKNIHTFYIRLETPPLLIAAASTLIDKRFLVSRVSVRIFTAGNNCSNVNVKISHEGQIKNVRLL